MQSVHLFIIGNCTLTLPDDVVGAPEIWKSVSRAWAQQILQLPLSRLYENQKYFLLKAYLIFLLRTSPDANILILVCQMLSAFEIVRLNGVGCGPEEILSAAIRCQVVVVA